MAGKRKLDASAIDQIFKETLTALTNARQQMFEIGENARAEYDRLQKSVHELKHETSLSIAAVDRLEKEARLARAELARISRDFTSHTQLDIRRAYERA